MSWDRGGAAAASLALAVLVAQPGVTTADASDAEDAAKPEGGAPAASSSLSKELSKELSKKEAELGWTFRALANEFGLRNYAAATRTETGLLFEYLPADETLDGWRTLGTLLLVPVGSSWKEGEDVLPRYVDAFRRRHKKVNDVATWHATGGPIWFMDYELDAGGPGHQHNLAAVWQLLPGTLAVFQTQRRAERFAPWQIDHFKRIAEQLDRAAEPAAEPKTAEPAP